MIDVHVRDDSDVGTREQERPVALVGLEDEDVTGSAPRAAAALVQVAADQVAGIESTPFEDHRDHRGGGRLAVRAGDGHGAMPGGERRQRLLPRPHGQFALPSHPQLRVRVADRARDDHRVGGAEPRGIVAHPHLGAGARPVRATPSSPSCRNHAPRCPGRAAGGRGCACPPPRRRSCARTGPRRDSARGAWGCFPRAARTTSCGDLRHEVRDTLVGVGTCPLEHRRRHRGTPRLVVEERRDPLGEGRRRQCRPRARPRRPLRAPPRGRWPPDGARWRRGTARGSTAPRRPRAPTPCPTPPSQRRGR